VIVKIIVGSIDALFMTGYIIKTFTIGMFIGNKINAISSRMGHDIYAYQVSGCLHPEHFPHLLLGNPPIERIMLENWADFPICG
jgi:hypothetical protein